MIFVAVSCRAESFSVSSASLLTSLTSDGSYSMNDGGADDGVLRCAVLCVLFGLAIVVPVGFEVIWFFCVDSDGFLRNGDWKVGFFRDPRTVSWPAS